MLARGFALPVCAPFLRSSRRCFSSAKQVARLSLAYSLHEPPKEHANRPRNHAIIFIHGLFGSKQNNRSMSKILARDLNRPVYAIDCRNHGDSPHDARHDYMALAEDVEDFIQEHNLEQPTLIGHSMGAKTAMTVALHNPSVIANLIAVDNAPIDVALTSDFPKYLQGMKKIEEAKVQKQSQADAILQDYEEVVTIRQFLLTNLARKTDDDTGETYLKFRIPLKILGSSLDHLGDFPYKDPDTVRFEKPTLFIRGTKSPYIADDSLPAVGAFFPCFELKDIDSGHWVIQEQPMAFKEAVEEFLDDKA